MGSVPVHTSFNAALSIFTSSLAPAALDSAFLHPVFKVAARALDMEINLGAGMVCRQLAWDMEKLYDSIRIRK